MVIACGIMNEIHCETHEHDDWACWVSSFKERICVWWFFLTKTCDKNHEAN